MVGGAPLKRLKRCLRVWLFNDFEFGATGSWMKCGLAVLKIQTHSSLHVAFS